jgi:hypothetical protein
MRDESGIIFLDYRQPLGIWEFFFGLLKAKKFQNEKVKAVGWYRRAPIPYVELRLLKTSDGETIKCYVYDVKLGFAIVLLLAGIITFIITLF